MRNPWADHAEKWYCLPSVTDGFARDLWVPSMGNALLISTLKRGFGHKIPTKHVKKHVKNTHKSGPLGCKKIQGIFEGVYLVLQLIPRRMVKVRPLKKLCGRQGWALKTLAFFEKAPYSGCVSNLSTWGAQSRC